MNKEEDKKWIIFGMDNEMYAMDIKIVCEVRGSEPPHINPGLRKRTRMLVIKMNNINDKIGLLVDVIFRIMTFKKSELQNLTIIDLEYINKYLIK